MIVIGRCTKGPAWSSYPQISSTTIERVLAAVFDSPFARVPYPSLDRSVFAQAPRLALHPGTKAFLARDRPLVTRDLVGGISSSISIFGATLGAVLFFVRSFRQRSEARREDLFAHCMQRIADIERRVVERELAATLELEPLVALQREILQLKGEALEHYASGDLGSHAVLSNILAPVNAARDHVGELILHVRDNLEEAAETRGTTAEALWVEAVSEPSEGSASEGA